MPCLLGLPTNKVIELNYTFSVRSSVEVAFAEMQCKQFDVEEEWIMRISYVEPT